MEQLPSELSGGMRKRVGIARGMANNPEIMLYDEPTSGLDPLTTGTITRLIMKLQRELDVTSVVVSHDIRSAFRMATQGRRCSTSGASSSSARRRRWRRRDDQVHPRLPGRVLTMKRSPIITWDQLRVGARDRSSRSSILGVADLQARPGGEPVHKRYQLIAFLPDANGLREGGSVMVAGQLAGTVKKIEFLPVDADTTRNLRLDARGRRRRAASRSARTRKGKLRTLGLLGDKVFDITPGTPRYRRCRDGDTITVVPSLDYEAVHRAGERRGERHGRAHAATCARITGGIVQGRGHDGPARSPTARSTTS